MKQRYSVVTAAVVAYGFTRAQQEAAEQAIGVAAVKHF
jgi:hypothetical protein